jgi:hypothetical protein
MPEATAPTSRWRVFRAPDAAGAIYGTIAAMAVIAGAARDPSHGKVLRLTVATLVVFWLAHAYAQALAHHLRGARKLEWSAIIAAMLEERPLLEGPAPLLVLLALGSLGVLDEHLAVNLALWVGVAQLVGWGMAYARRQQWGWPTAVTAGLVNGMFGSPSSPSRCSCTEPGMGMGSSYPCSSGRCPRASRRPGRAALGAGLHWRLLLLQHRRSVADQFPRQPWAGGDRQKLRCLGLLGDDEGFGLGPVLASS